MAYQSRSSDASGTPAATKMPEYLGRKGEGAMDKDEFASVVQRSLSQSVQFIDTEVSVERAKATDYYLGRPFGTEEEGRSKVILTEVRDAVDGMLPSMVRVFTGAEHYVEFAPTRPETVESAAQVTDYIRYLFEEENAGFLKILAVLKDGFVRKLGIFKWAWDETANTKSYRIEGIDQQQVDLLAAKSDEGVEVRSVEKRDDGLFNVDVTKTTDGRIRVWAVPPEEFIFNREARSLDEALLLGHRTDKTRGELLAMGIDEQDLDDHAGPGDTDLTLQSNLEEIARRDLGAVGRSLGSGFTNDPDMGVANDKVLYTETLMRVDYDGDGIAELRRICCIGANYYPVVNEPADDAMGFAVFTPYPEPHTLLGGSVADRTMDVQRINSALMRGMLDSLSAAIFPRTVYSEGMVSVADMLNTAIGAPIRARGDVNAALRTLDVPFTGKEAMPVMQFMQEVIERRTGRNKGAAGLDADALQSTGKEAVGAVLTGSQEQLELIARVFAEMTMKPLFRGLYKLVIARQQRSRMIRLRGQWTQIDPRSWDADMDVTVNVGLGSTFTDKKIQTLLAVAGDQKEIITSMGPSNPLVTLAQFRNTRAKVLALQGIKDVDSYYKPVDPNWQPPAPPTPPPDPATLAIQAEHQMNQLKVVKELAIEQDKLAMEKTQNDRDFQFKLLKQAQDVELRKYQIDAQFHGTLTQAQLDANVQREIKEAELTIQGHDQLHNHVMDQAQFSHDREMDQRAADTADTQAAQSAPTDSEGGE